MNIRPFREIKRRKTRVVNVGSVKIGGDNPISVQSMTNTLTTDVKATIKQIKRGRYKSSNLYGNGNTSAKIIKILERIKDINIQKTISF